MPEVLDVEEAVDILLDSRCRCVCRWVLPKPDEPSMRTLPTLPISVSVQSMEEMPRPTGAEEPDLNTLSGVLPDVRLISGVLEALDVPPLVPPLPPPFRS
jgi:hypothetical protein